ncbi:Uncharacterised protein [Pantoea agglomerans]|uniref:Uncharacterized protein n=1 Tax=Enterobacter agglomerans TaxID=549 RepID=A0A379AH76_ENTAG|nr:Uncharacterised protein [Pantoea agglomerans]
MLASAFTLMRAKANFVHQFIRNPRKMGSITPSVRGRCAAP